MRSEKTGAYLRRMGTLAMGAALGALVAAGAITGVSKCIGWFDALAKP
ncbi:MAG: hypothetical protein HY744_01715 [Deltaproteobacteria bacterium]|nr:hypothetical protein [Deltaproteobacteria bacterium]